MSLLNQMLNDLEKRGAHGASEEMPIRAVPAQSNFKIWRYAAGGVVLLGAVVVLGWALYKPAEAPPLLVSVAPAPAVSAVLSVSQVVAVSQVEVVSQVVVAEPPEMPELAIAPRLSIELSSTPLPRSLREQPLVELAAPIHDAPPRVVVNKPDTNATGSVTKQLKVVSPQQQAENEFRKANLLAQQGRFKEAAAGYEEALRLDAAHDMAREALVAVWLESRLNADAEKTLQNGLALNPKQTHFAMLLARLQVERNALPAALSTLEKALPYADQQGDYQAFVAALLQRQNRHKEAITHYQIALQLSPNSGLWLMGLGISLQAVQRKEDALDAYKRAIESRSLSPELQAYVMQRMQEIR